MPGVPDVVAKLPGPWHPTELVRANDVVVLVVRLDGEFPWHTHEYDEFFLCWDGTFSIELEGSDAIEMTPGDAYVVPSGVRHRPVATSVAHALLLERPDTVPDVTDRRTLYA